jgi:hypothetical protein
MKKKEKLSAKKIASYLSYQMSEDRFTVLSFNFKDLQKFANRKCSQKFFKKVVMIFVSLRVQSIFYSQFMGNTKNFNQLDFSQLRYFPIVRVYSREGIVSITDDLALLSKILHRSYESFSVQSYNEENLSDTELRHAKHCFRFIASSTKH